MRRILGLFLILFSISPISQADQLTDIATRCAPISPSEVGLKSSDFHWGYDLKEIGQVFQSIYNVNKRLPRRAYYDAKTKKILVENFNRDSKKLVLSVAFINAVTSHIENSLKLHYADAVFFPDMGHSHFLIPQAKWKKLYEKIPAAKATDLMQKLINDSDLNILYHTAEQITLLDENQNVLPDKDIQWRHHSRNVVGGNNTTGKLSLAQNPNSKANTVGSENVPNYFWWGSGFNISANKDGCFSYRNGDKTEYFDISFNDLESDEASSE